MNSRGSATNPARKPRSSRPTSCLVPATDEAGRIQFPPTTPAVVQRLRAGRRSPAGRSARRAFGWSARAAKSLPSRSLSESIAGAARSRCHRRRPTPPIPLEPGASGEHVSCEVALRRERWDFRRAIVLPPTKSVSWHNCPTASKPLGPARPPAAAASARGVCFQLRPETTFRRRNRERTAPPSARCLWQAQHAIVRAPPAEN